MTDTEIVNEILNNISADWGIRDDIISDLLHDMCPGRIVPLKDLVSGKARVTAADLVDIIMVREKLRRRFAVKTGSRL